MVQEIEQWLRRHQVFTEPAYLGRPPYYLGSSLYYRLTVIYRIEAKK